MRKTLVILSAVMLGVNIWLAAYFALSGDTIRCLWHDALAAAMGFSTYVFSKI